MLETDLFSKTFSRLFFLASPAGLVDVGNRFNRGMNYEQSLCFIYLRLCQIKCYRGGIMYDVQPYSVQRDIFTG